MTFQPLVKGFRVSAKKRLSRVCDCMASISVTPQKRPSLIRDARDAKHPSAAQGRQYGGGQAILRALQAAVEFVDKADDRSCWSARRV